MCHRFRKNMLSIFALFVFAFLQNGPALPSVCLREKHFRGPWAYFFNIRNWIFLMTMVDIYGFYSKEDENNIEGVHDGGLILDVFTTLCLKFPKLRNKALPPSSGRLNSVKWKFRNDFNSTFFRNVRKFNHCVGQKPKKKPLSVQQCNEFLKYCKRSTCISARTFSEWSSVLLGTVNSLEQSCIRSLWHLCSAYFARKPSGFRSDEIRQNTYSMSMWLYFVSTL